MTEKKLKEAIGSERPIKAIMDLLEACNSHYSTIKTSIILNNVDVKDKACRIIQHLDNPTLELEIEEFQVTSETKGYEPNGESHWKDIEVLNPTIISEELDKAYFITVDNIFGLNSVLISKEDKSLKFSSAKLLS